MDSTKEILEIKKRGVPVFDGDPVFTKSTNCTGSFVDDVCKTFGSHSVDLFDSGYVIAMYIYHKTDHEKIGIPASKTEIADAIRTQMNKTDISFWAESNGLLMGYVANTTKPGLSSVKKIKKILQEISCILTEKFDVIAECSLSGEHPFLQDIDIACDEAREALIYMIIHNTDRTIAYIEYKENTKSYGYYYTVEKEKQLLNLIKAGALDEAYKLLDEIYRENFIYCCMHVDLFDCFKYDIAGTMIKAIRDIFKLFCSNVIRDISPIEKIVSARSIAEVRYAAIDVIEGILTYSHTGIKSNSMIKVIDYIEKNYTNPSLSVSEICDYLNVHISYLSTAFKKQMGMRLSEYIRSVRIDKAKILLKKTGKNIVDIAKEVGYISPHTFTRVFKNSEGITPSKFREM